MTGIQLGHMMRDHQLEVVRTSLTGVTAVLQTSQGSTRSLNPVPSSGPVKILVGAW
jgi:hypothetical protein